MTDRLQILTTAALPLELKTLLERGHAGDATVLPELKQAFDQHPELATLLGDLSRHAEEAVLGLISGPSLTGREAVRHHADDLRQELPKLRRAMVENRLGQLQEGLFGNRRRTGGE